MARPIGRMKARQREHQECPGADGEEQQSRANDVRTLHAFACCVLHVACCLLAPTRNMQRATSKTNVPYVQTPDAHAWWHRAHPLQRVSPSAPAGSASAR